MAIDSDLSEGRLPPSSEGFTNHELEVAKDRRTMRRIAFYALGGVCLIYLFVLLCTLYRLLGDPQKFLPSGESAVHSTVIIGIAMVIFAAVPLSLAMSLVRMTSDSKENSKETPLTTPHLEFLKAVIEAVKAVVKSD